jgi:hypothetical protein
MTGADAGLLRSNDGALTQDGFVPCNDVAAGGVAG